MATLNTAGIDDKLFEVIVTGEDVEHIKPAPDGVLLALKKLKIKDTQAILIGDGTHDIEMARNAGVKTVGVTYGFGGEGIRASNPDFVKDKIEQLLEVLD